MFRSFRHFPTFFRHVPPPFQLWKMVHSLGSSARAALHFPEVSPHVPYDFLWLHPPAFRFHHVSSLRYLFPSSGYDLILVYSLVHPPVCSLSSNINYGHPLCLLRLPLCPFCLLCPPLYPKLGHSAQRGRNTQVEAASYFANVFQRHPINPYPTASLPLPFRLKTRP